MFQSYHTIQAINPTFKLGVLSLPPKLPKRPDRLYSFLQQTLNDILEGRYLRCA